MSQVYDWLNFDKHEKLDWWWSCGGKLWGSNWTSCEENNALLTLLAGRWKGDRIIRFGCEGLETPEDGRPFLEEIDSGMVDDIEYESEDITGLFEETRGHPRDVLDEDGHFIGEEPIEGPFELKLEWYRYIVNTERRQFIDRERAAVQCIRGMEVVRDDVFTVLVTPFYRAVVGGEEIVGASWFGEVLSATNERPGEGYADVTGVHSEYGTPTDLADEEILAYVSVGAPDYEVDPDGWERYANERLDELLGV